MSAVLSVPLRYFRHLTPVSPAWGTPDLARRGTCKGGVPLRCLASVVPPLSEGGRPSHLCSFRCDASSVSCACHVRLYFGVYVFTNVYIHSVTRSVSISCTRSVCFRAHSLFIVGCVSLRCRSIAFFHDPVVSVLHRFCLARLCVFLARWHYHPRSTPYDCQIFVRKLYMDVSVPVYASSC